MSRRNVSFTAILTAILLMLALTAAGGASARGRHYVAGSAGVGDPYYPLYGNGGYDVGHYLLKLSMPPAVVAWWAAPRSRLARRRTSTGSTSTCKACTSGRSP